MKEIQLILKAPRGAAALPRLTAVLGDRVGTLPEASRRGYVFAGWYLGADGSGARVTEDTVLTDELFGGTAPDEAILCARFERPDRAPRRRATSLASQRRAAVILLAVVLGLAALLGAVRYLVSVYRFEDFDGETYVIRRKHGAYGLYLHGDRCDVNDDGYYLTRLGTQLSIDPKTGERRVFAVVDTSGTEVVGAGRRILMFKQLTYDQSSTKDASKVIRRFEIHNRYGDFALNRGQGNRFVIEGHEGTLLFDELFAQLSNGCGYTLSLQRLEDPVRLEDGSIDYAEYGLVPETRPAEDGEGTVDYQPARYAVITMTDDRYEVTIGDPTVSGAGYYARYADRDTVYILPSVHLDAAVLQPVETLVMPMIVYPMRLNNYFNVENFVYRTDMDYDGMTRDIILELTGLDTRTLTPDAEGRYPAEAAAQIEDAWRRLDAMGEDEASRLYDRALAAHSRIVTAFSYVDMDARLNTLYSSVPYRMASDYMAGYLPNSDNIGKALQLLYSMKFERTVSLAPDEETLERYGLDRPAHLITFLYHDTDGADRSNEVSISAKTEDGLYYAYSPNFDLVVEFEESQAPYLEWEEIDWYEREYFSHDITHIREIRLDGQLLPEPIRLIPDNRASDQSKGPNSDRLVVYAADPDGRMRRVDYRLTVTKPSGSVEEEDAVYNFRRFVQSMLTASLEGEADLTEERMAAFRAAPDSACRLRMTVFLDDGRGNVKNAVYRFYQYTERKAYMTIELLDSPDDPPDPARGQGTFFVLRSFCDKIVHDAGRFLSGEEIVVESKS